MFLNHFLEWGHLLNIMLMNSICYHRKKYNYATHIAKCATYIAFFVTLCKFNGVNLGDVIQFMLEQTLDCGFCCCYFILLIPSKKSDNSFFWQDFQDFKTPFIFDLYLIWNNLYFMTALVKKMTNRSKILFYSCSCTSRCQNTTLPATC